MIIIYKASDGKEFNDKKKCKEYETQIEKAKEAKKLITKIEKLMVDKGIELKITDSAGVDNNYTIIEFMIANHDLIGKTITKKKPRKVKAKEATPEKA